MLVSLDQLKENRPLSNRLIGASSHLSAAVLWRDLAGFLIDLFLRVPRRVNTWLPQCGHASGTFNECGARAARGNGDIGEVLSPYHDDRGS